MQWVEGPAAARTLEVVRGLASPMGATEGIRAPGACTWVPRAGNGVCGVCHASAPPGRATCFTCRRTAGQVSAPVLSVTPISLFRTGDALWRVLRGYKDAGRAGERRDLRRHLSWLLSQFLRYHLACIAPEADQRWAITTVAPTHRRAEARPLELAIRQAGWLRGRYLRTLRTVRSPEHNAASDRAFAVTRRVAGHSFVLVDDTLTTGASVQSAASALQQAGAAVLAVVVVGRVVNPGASPAEARLWEHARSHLFDLSVCCTPGCHGNPSFTPLPVHPGYRSAPGKLGATL